MKILSIRIKNLASLAGEHFIDFESEPLASAGLVAIVGKTGAGKSTILDAMCLALFNKIPRLKDSDGKLLDADGSELLTNSPLTVLRRGTAHGYAELCFVAQDQKHYLARWELKRSREKADGKLQNVQRYLKCLSDGVVVADKAKAVDASVLKITQLSFEQFTRAVLLAQSEVTAFLKARDNERGELLEYLTNSSIFAKIGQLAYEKTKQVSVKRKELENLLGHIEILSDDAVAELTAQFQQADTAYQQLETDKSQLEKQQQWFERKHKLDSEIILKQHSVDAQLKSVQDLSPERDQLNRLETFSAIRPMVFQQQQYLNTEQQLAPQIQMSQNTFKNVLAQFETEKASYTQAETALHRLQRFEQQHHAALQQVRKCVQERDFIATDFKKAQQHCTELENSQKPLIEQQQKIQAQIQQYSAQQAQIQQQLLESVQFSRLDNGLNAHIQQLAQFIQQYQKIEHESGHLPQLEQQLSAQQAQLQQWVEQSGSMAQIDIQLEQLRENREGKLMQLNQLHVFQQHLTQYFAVQNEEKQLENTLKETSAHIQQIEKDAQQAEQTYQSAQMERLKLQEILQQQRLLHAENVEHLRAELQDGEPCLVCGSTSHPYKKENAALSKALFELQQQQEQQAEQQEQQSLKRWQEVQHQLTRLQTEQTQSKSAILQLHEKRSAIHTDLTRQLNTLNIQLDLTGSHTAIHAELEQITTQFKAEIQQLESRFNQLSQSYKHQQQLQQDIQRTESVIQTAKQLLQQVQHIAECLPAKEQLIWQQQASATAQHIQTQLQQRVQQIELFEQAAKQLDLYSQQLHGVQLNLQNIAKQIEQSQQHLAEIKLKGQQNTETAQQLIDQMTGPTELKPNDWMAKHDTERQQLQQQYQQHKHSFEQSRQTYEQQKSELEKLQAQRAQNQHLLQQANAEIEQWLAQHPDFQSQDLDVLLQISPEEMQQIRTQLQNADRLLNEAQSALKTMQEQLAEHLLHQSDEIDQMQLLQLIQNNTAQLKQQSELRDQLKLELAKYQSNLAQQRQFAQQIQEIQQEEHRWGKISGLIGDSKGKDFRDYAQQYNLDILLEHANQQLNMLSQRYTLKRLDNSLSLAIIDHDMDGETRSVASLSGGESFLTALALSLAIANMASGSMKIESLFIDEGFGTLDASSLHMVMNALDQLQNQGRKVVLISHIQEMHERIPVQIQVKPVGSGASKIEIVG